MKTIRSLCVCLCVTFLSIGFSASALADTTYTNTNLTAAVNTTNNNITIVTNNGDYSVASGYVISGSGSVTKQGGNKFTIESKSTYTGGTTVSGGTLVMNTIKQKLTGTVTVTGEGSVLSLVGNRAIQQEVDNPSLVTVENGGNIIIGDFQYFNNVKLNNGGSITGASIRFGLISKSKLTVTGTAQSTIDKMMLVKLSSGTTLTVDVASGASLLVPNGIVDNTESSGIYKGAKIVKTGAGTLTISGASDFTGGTTISAGRIIATNASALGTGTVTNNSELEFNLATATDSGTYSKVLAGSGALYKTGAGTLTLSGVNTYTGSTTVSGGTLVMNTNNQKLLGAVTVTGEGSVLSLDGKRALQQETVNLPSLVTVKDGGKITIGETYSEAFQYFNNLSLENGGSITATGNKIRFGFFPASSIKVTGTAQSTIDKMMLVKHADGTILTVDVASEASLLVPNGIVDNTESSTYKGTSITKTGEGKFTIFGTSDFMGGMTISGGRIIATTASALGTGAVKNNSELEFNLSTDDSGTYSKVLSGSGALYKTGDGTLTLSAKNTYTGATTVSEGTLKMTYNEDIKQNLAGAVTVTGEGSVLSLDGRWALSQIETTNALVTVKDGGIISIGETSSNAFQYFNNLLLDNGGSITATGNNIRFGYIDNPNIEVKGTAQSSIDKMTLVKKIEGSTNVTINVDPGASLHVNNGIVDFNEGDPKYKGSSITKTGAGTLTISGTSDFIGDMTISEGKVSVATGSTSLGAGALTLNNGATLIITGGDLNETLAISGAATLNGTLDLTNYLNTWNTGSIYTLMTANSIVSTEGLNLSGAGTGWGWEQSDNSILLKYSGGTLGWNWTGTTGSFMTAANWENNAVPETASDVTISNADGVAQIDENATVKTVTLGKASNLQFTAGNTLTAETMTIGGENPTLNLTGGSLTLTNAPAFNINNSDTDNASTLTLSTGTYANVLSGNTNLAKTGDDTLTLSGVNTYTGATTVSGGTLALGIDNAIASSTSVENNAAITFDNTSQTFKALTGTGTITGSGALTLVNAATADSSYSGTITGSAALTKTGTGTLTLSCANNYYGGTTISGGTLAISNSEALGTGTITLNGGMLSTTASETIVLDESVAINANSTIDTTNGLTLSGSISGTAALTKTGTGTLTLSGSGGSYSGTTTVSAGKLSITNSSAISDSAKIIIESGAEIESNAIQTIHNLNGSGTYKAGGDLTINSTLSDNLFNGTIDAGTSNIIFTGNGSQKMSFGPSPTDGSLTATLVKLQSGRLDIKGVMDAGLEINGGTFSPGNSVGSLTANSILLNGGTALFEFDRTLGSDGAWDTLTIDSGNITLTSGVFSLYIDDYNYWHKVGEEYQLITGTTAYATDTDLTDWLASAYQSSWSLTGKTGGIYLSAKDTPITSVPEPSTWALLILGTLGMMYFRRKK